MEIAWYKSACRIGSAGGTLPHHGSFARLARILPRPSCGGALMLLSGGRLGGERFYAEGFVYRCPQHGLVWHTREGIMRRGPNNAGGDTTGDKSTVESRATGQNQNFAASCTTRGSSAVVIVPKLAGPSCAAGAPRFAVFARLKTSSRSSIARPPPTPTRRITAKSTSRTTGPRTGLREAEPMVN